MKRSSSTMLTMRRRLYVGESRDVESFAEMAAGMRQFAAGLRERGKLGDDDRAHHVEQNARMVDLFGQQCAKQAATRASKGKPFAVYLRDGQRPRAFATYLDAENHARAELRRMEGGRRVSIEYLGETAATCGLDLFGRVVVDLTDVGSRFA